MLDLRTDVIMCYGVGPGDIDRIAGWKAQGYCVHTMAVVAWGNYQDYLYGRFGGINHEDEAQTEKKAAKSEMAAMSTKCRRVKATANFSGSA